MTPAWRAAGLAFEPAQRGALRGLGVRSGRLALFIPALLKPRAAAMRAQLLALQLGVPVPVLPAAGLVSVPCPGDWPAGFALALGWVEAGPMLLRLDVAEQVAGELGWATRKGARAVPAGLASRLSIKPDLLPVALRALGFRVVPGWGRRGGVWASGAGDAGAAAAAAGFVCRAVARRAGARAVRGAGGVEAVAEACRGRR